MVEADVSAGSCVRKCSGQRTCMPANGAEDGGCAGCSWVECMGRIKFSLIFPGMKWLGMLTHKYTHEQA